MAGGKQTVM